MEDVEWDSCPVHGKRCRHYCEKHKVLVCSECEKDEHRGCGALRTAEYVKLNAKRLPSQEKLGTLLPQIDKALEDTNTEGTSKREECDALESRLGRLEELEAHSEDILQNDRDLVDRALGYMDEVGLRARTGALRGACERAKEVLSVKGEIAREVRVIDDIEGIRRQVEERKRELNGLVVSMLQLDKVRGAG